MTRVPRAVRLRATFEAVLDVLPSLANVAIVVVGAQRVQSGDLSIGELTSFIYLFTLLVFPLRLIGYVLSAMPFSLSGWTRVREVLDEPIEPDPHAAVATAPDGVGLRLDDVTFTFAGEAEPAVGDVSLTVPTGRVVAVVGPTGAGKSTLVELSGGLVAPDSGTVATSPGAITGLSGGVLVRRVRSATTWRWTAPSTTSGRGRPCAWRAPTTSSPIFQTASTRWWGSVV